MGETALHIACEVCADGIVAMLLARGGRRLGAMEDKEKQLAYDKIPADLGAASDLGAAASNAARRIRDLYKAAMTADDDDAPEAPQPTAPEP
mmetsp:Transcript_24056/g.59782  ORF Transcript_24056/g.59782 Transcript_24056/m.59782 type:complete len:92 (+) Transcript_24056:139-414(+)